MILEFGGRREQCGLDTFDVSRTVFRQAMWLWLDLESVGQRVKRLLYGQAKIQKCE